MPLYKTIYVNLYTTVYIWHITETLEELKKLSLSQYSKERISSVRSEFHKKGIISIFHLLCCAGYRDYDLYYTKDGKPHLRDGTKISITHSFEFSAIIISNNDVGIDIEKNRSKILRVAHKFIDTKNSFLKTENKIEKLTVVWAAKESLFKIHPQGGLLFIEHLPIEPFSLKEKTTIGWINRPPIKKPYNIYFEIFPQGYAMVYTLPKKN